MWCTGRLTADSNMPPQVPASYRKLVITKLTPRFREATETVSEKPPALGDTEVLVENHFAGINASDINYAAGRYDPNHKPPMDVGFEGVGVVVAAGANSGHQVGQAVIYLKPGAFSEYRVLEGKEAIPIPAVSVEYLPFILSGLTAALGLDKVGQLQAGQTVLVTAAAGGTGQFAVQWAKNAGCTVIGTCSSTEKMAFLKSIGCDRPVNYKEENLGEVLKKEYPKGVDVVYECIGGDMFHTAVDNLAKGGRVVIIGFISKYEKEEMHEADPRMSALPGKLLMKSGGVHGFFLGHFPQHFPEYMKKFVKLHAEGKIQSVTDDGKNSPQGPFRGLDSIVDAVEYLYSGQSVGKIVVNMKPQ